ncbi:serine--tRNA ligase [Thermoproteota archaeon]
MIDPKLIRDNFEQVAQALTARGFLMQDLEAYQELDKAWRVSLQELDKLKYERNQTLPKGKPSPEQLKLLSAVSEKIKDKQEKLNVLENALSIASMELPNIILEDVPIGTSEKDNREVCKRGAAPEFDFKPKSHDELGQKLGILDFEGASRISGSRFAVYKGLGAKLERALINFMLDIQTGENGYTEILPPCIVNRNSLIGTGQLPKFEGDCFHLTDTDYYLSPTAEVQLTNLYQNCIVSEQELPIKLAACTPCFRREAGSYGKDVAGIIRQHQFNKVELVQLVKPEESVNTLESLLKDAESILQKLELPYRVVKLCSADLGFSSAKTYDLEVWLPSQKKYREISSCSNFLDFQSRRAMIRYKRLDNDKVYYLHTLNGSGLAVGRTVAAILENCQTSSGQIIVPKVLEAYIGVKKIG